MTEQQKVYYLCSKLKIARIWNKILLLLFCTTLMLISLPNESKEVETEPMVVGKVVLKEQPNNSKSESMFEIIDVELPPIPNL